MRESQSSSPPLPMVVERALSAAADHRGAGRADTACLLYDLVLAVEPDNAAAIDGLAAGTPIGRGTPPGPGGAALRPRRALARRLGSGAARPALEALVQQPRVWKYRALSTCRRVQGSPRILQPVLFAGMGEVVLGEDVQFGWRRSPLFYTGYCHVEVAHPSSRIELGDRTEFNNNLFIKSEGAGIRVGRDGLFGANVEIVDSNFHDLHPRRRHDGRASTAMVDIGPNVFVGMGVKILKGVTIGADSVIGAGAVVASSIPAGVIATGCPARVVREL
jgi:maltose O-acetyltransferase